MKAEIKYKNGEKEMFNIVRIEEKGWGMNKVIIIEVVNNIKIYISRENIKSFKVKL